MDDVTSTSLTPEQRRIRARVAAYALHAQGGTSTTAGTAAFLARFERDALAAAEQRGERLAQPELTRRALLARKAYFARLALASSRARSSKRKAVPAIGTPRTATEAPDAAGDSRTP